MWPITLNHWLAKRPAMAATGWSALSSGRHIPQQLAELRHAMPHTLFLIPGFGAQGGTAKDCAAAFDPSGLGANRQQQPRHHLCPLAARI